MDNVITGSGGISASWMLTILMGLIGSLILAIIWLGYQQMISTLKNIDKSIESLMEDYEALKEDHNEVKSDVKVMKETNKPEAIAKMVFMELKQYKSMKL